MYARIKELADSAVALQNKINMEAALREISGICSIELDDAWIDKSLASAGDLTEASLEAATTAATASGEKLSFVPTHIAFPVSDGTKPKTKKGAKK